MSEEKSEEPKKEIEESQYRYRVPAIPAIVAMLNAKTFYFFGPYWVMLFLFCLVKNTLIEDGVSALDWVFLFLWIPFACFSKYFGWQMIKSVEHKNVWPWLISSIVAIVLEIYFVALQSTVLYLEYIISIFVIIWQIILLVGCAIAAYIQSRPMKIQPEE